MVDAMAHIGILVACQSKQLQETEAKRNNSAYDGIVGRIERELGTCTVLYE